MDEWRNLDFFEYHDIKCQPFSTWPIDFRLSAILQHIKESLVIPAVFFMLYALIGGLRVENSRRKVVVPLILILLSIICSSCYVSWIINLEEQVKELFACSAW